MLIYIYIIAIASFFAYIAQRCYHFKWLFIMASVFAILIPSFFSGMRDLDVGYDVMFYEYGAFKSALSSHSFHDLTSIEDVLEPGFLLINYISSLISNDIHVALGLISFLTILFIYLACVRCRNECPLWLLYAICMLYNYASSNNLMRQTLAASVCFYAFTLLKDYGLKWQYVLFSFLAFTCHTTSIVPIMAFLIYYVISKMSRKTVSNLFPFLILGCITVYIAFTQLLSVLSNFSDDKDYSIYGDNTQTTTWSETYINTSMIILLLLCLITIRYIKKKYTLDFYVNYKYKYTILLCFLSVSLGTYNGSAARLLIYFIFILMFYICRTLNIKCIKTNRRYIFNLMILVIFMYLYFRSFYDGLEYHSRLLNIN